MSKGSRLDKLRLREIFTRLIEPWDDCGDELSAETKLWYALRPEDYPIYKRRILKVLPVNGLWWMNESQWLRFMWQGHNAVVLKSGQDPDRVLATRSFRGDSWLYIRHVDDHVDLEGRSQVLKWDPIKKKSRGSCEEWLTVSITLEAYKNLDTFLGPVTESCNHKEGPYDYLAE